MAAAWAQAKLERVKRSYNETSRGMGFAAHAYAPRRVKNLDSERSEHRVSEANKSQFSGAYIGLAFIKHYPVTVKTVLKPLTGFTPLKSRNRLPMYGCRLGPGKSGSEVIASAAKL